MSEHGGLPDLPWTGERVVPAAMDPNDAILLDHLSRYLFAQRFAAGRTVLDAASGAGYGCAMLAEAGARRVVGIECDEASVRYAGRLYGGPGVEFVKGDVEAMPFDDRLFDVVVSFETIEHLDHPEAFLAEVARVLVPGGLFVVSTPNNPTGVTQNPFHRREYPAREFSALLATHFAAVEMWGQHHRPVASPDNVRREGWDHACYLVALCAAGRA